MASGDLWAGAENQLYNLCLELSKYHNIKLKVILLNHGLLEENLSKIGISVVVFDESRFSGFRIFFAVLRVLLRFKPDVLHTHRKKENILGSIAALLAGNYTSIRTVHGSKEFVNKPWLIHKNLYDGLERLSGRHLQKNIVSVSEQLSHQLAADYPRSSILTIENGVNTEQLRQNGQSKAELPGHQTPLRIAFIGRMTSVKRFDLILDIAKALQGTRSDIASFYAFGDGPLLEENQQRCTKMALDNIVHFMGFQTNIAPYLQQMDILLIVSDHEGLPMNLLEAMALKVYVIAHAVGGIPAVLANGQFGTLLHDQDPEKYAQAILDYAANIDAHRHKARLAAQHIETNYSADAMTRKYLQLYEKYIG